MLIGPRTKLARAAQHINELSSKVTLFAAAEPYHLEVVEEGNGDLVYRLRMKQQAPLEWSAIAGDAVHNLRTALDHLACALVTAGGASPTRSTQFPFTNGPVGIGKAIRQSLAGASRDSRRFVKRLRPYGGGSAVLAQINSLDNTDKHQSVLVVGAAHRSVLLRPNFPKFPNVEFPTIGLRPADRQFPLRDGDAVLRIRKAARMNGDEDGRIDYPGVTIEPAFGQVAELEGLPLLPTLEKMHAHVTKIIDIAERRLLT